MWEVLQPKRRWRQVHSMSVNKQCLSPESHSNCKWICKKCMTTSKGRRDNGVSEQTPADDELGSDVYCEKQSLLACPEHEMKFTKAELASFREDIYKLFSTLTARPDQFEERLHDILKKPNINIILII